MAGEQSKEGKKEAAAGGRPADDDRSLASCYAEGARGVGEEEPTRAPDRDVNEEGLSKPAKRASVPPCVVPVGPPAARLPTTIPRVLGKKKQQGRRAA